MSFNSWTVTAATDATADQYNNLRKDVLEAAGEYVTSGGSANAQTFTISAQITAYKEGMVIPFKAGYTNTGAATGNVNAIGAKDIKLPDGSALSAGDITAGRLYELRYDGTNLILMNGNGTLLATGTYTAGLTTGTFTADNTTDTFTSTNHGLQNGDKITVASTVSVPTGMSGWNTVEYYVRDRTANTFKVSTNWPYQTALNITDDWVGTLTWTFVPASINLSFAAKTHLKIVVYSGVPTASSILRMVFNWDGWANYGTRQSSNGASDSINSTRNDLTELAGVVGSNAKITWIEILNIASIRKQGHFNWGTDNNANAVAPSTCHGNLVWNNTSDQITSLTVYLNALAGMGTGAIAYVYGWN